MKKVAPQSMVHLTEKPVELAVRAIQYSSRTGENVLDLFGGSGSTLIAAEQTGRNAYLVEIDPLVVEGCREHIPQTSAALDDPRAQVTIADGVAFVDDL